MMIAKVAPGVRPEALDANAISREPAVVAAYRAGLRRSALFLGLLVPAQIALGAMTVLSRKSVPITTAHVATGALLLGTSLALSLSAMTRVRREQPAELFVESRALAWK